MRHEHEGMCRKDFIELRKKLQSLGLVPSCCREEGAYYYSSNRPHGKRERSIGSVVFALRGLAIDNGIDIGDLRFFPVSWAGKWPRTQSSKDGENEGQEAFLELLERVDPLLRQKGIFLKAN